MVDVRLNGDVIDVKSPEYFDSAMKLAQTYESQGEPEFTIKKDYA